jgi:hypothetical protein
MFFLVLPPVIAILVFWAVLGRLGFIPCSSALTLFAQTIGLAIRAFKEVHHLIM